jgi:hypothetical protein
MYIPYRLHFLPSVEEDFASVDAGAAVDGYQTARVEAFVVSAESVKSAAEGRRRDLVRPIVARCRS